MPETSMPGDWPWPSRFHETRDGTLHHVDVGSGPVVVFAHGTPTSSYEWRRQIASLSASHRCIALDHLGFGGSARPAQASYTPESHAQRFRSFIDAVIPTEPVTLVIHDFGGPIALDWALDHPDRLARLVVMNSWMWSFEDDPVMWKRGRIVDGWLGRQLYRHANASLRLIMPSAYGKRSRLDPMVHAYYQSLFPDPDSRELVLYALARSLTHSSPYFASLWERRERLCDVPTTIVWGLADSAFQPPCLERWRVACPRADVAALEGIGHWPHEEAGDEVTAVLQRILGVSS